MRNLKRFNTNVDFEATYKIGAGYEEPWTSFVDENSGVTFNKTEEEKKAEMKNMPVTFEVLSGGMIVWMYDYYGQEKTIYYSKNGEEWSGITSKNDYYTAPRINVSAGDTIRFKGNNDQYGYKSTTGREGASFFSGSAIVNVCGNIMSLVDAENFEDLTTFKSGYTFYTLFKGLKIENAENLILPATAVTNACYKHMFSGCKTLVTAPELPALSLAENSYLGMFSGCTALLSAPNLPATSLAPSCYSGMFNKCTSLTTAPALPATTLANYCYNGMFTDCTSLTAAPELPATTMTFQCYYAMFAGCTSLVTPPKLPATTLNTYCYSNMFSGCTSLITAPVLAATNLAIYCYESMFVGCTSLITPPELPATTAKERCYYQMFWGCKSLTTAPALPATTLASYCYASMFWGCNLITTAPELPARALEPYCYEGMFRYCSSLNYVKAMFLTTPGRDYTSNWLNGVASSGTFVKNINAEWDESGVNGIPEGWTVQTESPSE